MLVLRKDAERKSEKQEEQETYSILHYSEEEKNFLWEATKISNIPHTTNNYLTTYIIELTLNWMIILYYSIVS